MAWAYEIENVYSYYATSDATFIADDYKNGVKVSSYHYGKTEPVDYLYHSTVPVNNSGQQYELWITAQWRFSMPNASGTATLNVFFKYKAYTDSCPHAARRALSTTPYC